MIFIAGATNQPIEVLERTIPIRYSRLEDAVTCFDRLADGARSPASA